MELQALLEYQAVRNWMDGLREHWGGDPETDDPDRLPTLEEFCRFADADPDAIIGACMRVDKSGDPRISVKGRRKYAGLIDEFQANAEGSRTLRAKRGNTVRSFLIHNGVLLSGGAQLAQKE